MTVHRPAPRRRGRSRLRGEHPLDSGRSRLGLGHHPDQRNEFGGILPTQTAAATEEGDSYPGGGHPLGAGGGTAVRQAGRGPVGTHRDLHDLGEQGRQPHHRTRRRARPVQAGRRMARRRPATCSEAAGSGVEPKAHPRRAATGRQDRHARQVAEGRAGGQGHRPGDAGRRRPADHPAVEGRPAASRSWTGHAPSTSTPFPARTWSSRPPEPASSSSSRSSSGPRDGRLLLHAAAEGQGPEGRSN